MPSDKDNIELEIQSWRSVLSSLNEQRIVLLRAKNKCEQPGAKFSVPENLFIELETVNRKMNDALDKINQLKSFL